MAIDIPAHLDFIDKCYKQTPEHITYLYQKTFGPPDGELVLVDLMDRFFEFKPTMSDREAGAQAVLIHIKNMIRGQIDTSKLEQPMQGDQNAE
jgi:hypothetical protein